MRTVQRATDDHGVTFFETDIDRDGGKIMLVAGAPRSNGHDEERMLRTARQIMDGMAGLQEMTGHALPLRIGVNRGNVFAGGFGPRLPAHLLHQGRRGQPGRARHGQGRAR